MHTIVASDWSEQQQDYNLLPQTLWAGNVNIGPMAIRAVFKPYSEHDFTSDPAGEFYATYLDQRFGFGSEPRFSRDMPEFGKICSLEYVIKAGLCRRLSRRVNMIASKNPVKAPRNASVIERLLKVRSPWPVRRNPVYAIATVQRITRTGCMGGSPRDEQILPQFTLAE